MGQEGISRLSVIDSHTDAVATLVIAWQTVAAAVVVDSTDQQAGKARQGSTRNEPWGSRQNPMGHLPGTRIHPVGEESAISSSHSLKSQTERALDAVRVDLPPALVTSPLRDHTDSQ